MFCQGDCPRPDSLLTSQNGLLLVLQIREVGDFGVRIFNGFTHRILPVEISLNGGSFLVTIGKSAQQPPYRIENRSALLQSSGLCNISGSMTHPADRSWPWLGGLACTARKACPACNASAQLQRHQAGHNWLSHKCEHPVASPNARLCFDLYRCEHLKVRFQQRDAEADVWDVVEAGKTVDYAWDEPMQVRLSTMPRTAPGRCDHHYFLRLFRASRNIKFLLPMGLCPVASQTGACLTMTMSLFCRPTVSESCLTLMTWPSETPSLMSTTWMTSR